ncbi:hypothetical protein ABB37_02734 [Leptomonas pyrrhocoris]|uniref:Transmembrane protein n=1 Tax=Leptomonas pyrrhocoris TaxID=157538 RepID=A0A0N0VG80_LEPPY|nr:hypothetical protein ABB37_02734 [Leptomonas pyrrhocoris]KPA83001.1 hypothetical protein ABB37_02734 [Leptomonas pyrrhocoris]|eukprot:XP_015661440.1 hypothetical protein ABB37_02734 [Leptomonas pyrrhocoris]
MQSLRRASGACAVALLALLLCDALVPSPYYTVTAATEEVEERALDPAAFSNLVQLTEAVLAPVWGTGGYAYAMDGFDANRTRSLRPVCIHTRTSPSLVTAPFTFAMFDRQFSPLYGVTADNTAASVRGQLDLQRRCYVSLAAAASIPLTSPTRTDTEACIAGFVSQAAQCALGSEDALDLNWTADALTSEASATAEPAQTTASLPASGLSASELFATFLNDYLPQRAWLRTVVPRSLDVLHTAMQAARVFHTSAAALTEADEVSDMQRAIASEWNTYLWNTYGPQLRRKWNLFYRFAVATLTRGGIAPSLKVNASVNVSGYSITGVAGPVRVTSCPLVDAWLPLRYSPDDLSVTRLAHFMEAALNGLAESLAAIHRSSSSGGNVAQTDDLLFHLIHSAYCVTTTNLFSLTALLDRAFLQVVSSAWLDVADRSDSWAWQTMRTASVTEAMNSASAFQSSTSAQVRALSSSLSTSLEKSFVRCLASFLDPTTPLTSTTVVSPSDCVRQFLETRDASVSLSENFTVLFELDQLSAVSSAGSVPGMTRYESVVALPVVGGAVRESLQWFAVQESALALTAQTSLFTPAPSSAPLSDSCTSGTQSPVSGRGGDWIYDCPAGTYVLEEDAACATCPSACAALRSAFARAAVPVYCPGDGLLHGCPPRPVDAVYAGSTDEGQTGPYAICRYACANVYTAPMNYSCLSVSGTYYNTAATGNVDVYNGGGLSPCREPTSLFPAAAPVRSQTRLYAFVGSGTTNAPLTCPFTLLHRATSSAVTLKALVAAGLAPPRPFFHLDAPVAAAASTLSPLLSRSGVTWEVEVQLNATQMYAMHAALRPSLKEQTGNGPATPTSTVAHELVAWQRISSDDSSAGDAERVLAWYLVSTFAQTSDGDNATVSLQFLLNLSVATPPTAAAPAASSVSTVDFTTASSSTTTSTTSVPSSLVVLSSAWLWSPSSSNTATAPLSTSTYRAVLNRATNTIAFYVDGSSTPLGATSVTVDWPLWAPAAPTTTMMTPEATTTNMGTNSAAASTDASFFLSVGGWVAGYAESRQWILVTPSTTASASHAASGSVTLPLYYDYLPGMVTRVLSAASLIHPLQDTLQSAENSWHAQASARAAAQAEQVAQLTSLLDLAHYVSIAPAVASSVSSTLHALALRTTKGLDGVCRPDYGVLPTSRSDAVCEVCMKGAYTVMDIATTAGSNRCTCVPQRVWTVETDAATNQPISVCRVRRAGPAMPQGSLTAAGTLYVDGDVVDRASATTARIPLGWYAAAAVASADSTLTTSLSTSVLCTLGLTSPTTTTNYSAEAHFNTSVMLRYTTGLGGETCEARAAAFGGGASSAAVSSPSFVVDSTSGITKPTYTDLRLYSTRLQAPALTGADITLKNNSALFTDQTVFAIGVHDYALLSFYAVHSILKMAQMTEYQLAFLAYVLRSATVSSKLDCDGDQRKGSAARDFTWVSGSALNTSVLWLNLTETITRDCVVTLRVTSTATAASESTVPFPSWPHSYLRVPPSIPPSSFFESSPTLVYVVRAPSAAFTATEKHNVLGELSSFLMAGCIVLLSLALGVLRAISEFAPSLELLPWRRYEREMEKLVTGEEDN